MKLTKRSLYHLSTAADNTTSLCPNFHRRRNKRRRASERDLYSPSSSARPTQKTEPTTNNNNNNSSNSTSLYHCDNCAADLTNFLRVKCAVCPDFDLCLHCFRIGVEFKGHLSNHAYRVVDDLSFPIYHPEWGAEEELHLLEAIETYGLGNWTKVAEHLGRTPEVCRDHYFATYIDTDTFPLPKRAPELQNVDISRLIEEQRTTGNRTTAKWGKTSPTKKGGKGKGATDEDEEEVGLVRVKSEPMDGDIKAEELDEEEEHIDASSGAAGKKGAAKKHHKNDPKSANPKVKAEGGGSAVAPPGGASNVGLRIQKNQQQQQQQDGTTLGSSSLLPPGQAGKSPHSSSPAAKVVAGETVNTGYNIKRNEFDPEYDYEAETIISELDFKEGELPEETARKVRLIEIYNRRLDERLKRRAFVLERGLVNVKARQAVDRKTGSAERDYVGRLRVLARYLPQEQFEELADGMVVEAKLRSRIAELQSFRTMGLRNFLQTDEWESEGKKRKEPTLPSQGQSGKTKLQRIPVDDTALQAELAETMHLPHAAMALGTTRTTLLDGRGNGLGYWRRRRGVLLDITVLPDAESLSGPERMLCAAERYLPAQYLAVKAAALELQAKNGGVTKQDLLGLPFKVIPSRMERLFDYLVEHKCVTPL